ncbi:radical SAM protein [Bradyrhizobium cosmicum]|uniref:radical SAM protein n=1 Tax=Bradyrhizobium cosmicum TaxID=1404864 RepID=UPI0028EA7CAF|nr:radical SAM protein [Bradyrhizobium cosmicum]
MSFLAQIFRRLNGPRSPPEKLRCINRLELHVTHACNLTCESCSHYSNHGHAGNLDLAAADRWMTGWSNRLEMEEFCLLGGEPTVHPLLADFVPLVRRHWPKTRIRIVTNGFLLRRHPELPIKMMAAGNCDIALSVHHDASSYRERLQPSMDLLDHWQSEYGTVVHTWLSHGVWTRRYTGSGVDMLPFEDGNPRRSWEICPARHCKQLHDGKIWKCAPLAYLGLQKAKYDISAKWNPYLNYAPLDPSATNGELDQFLAQEDESVCAMCSSEPRNFLLPNPLRGAAEAMPDPS